MNVVWCVKGMETFGHLLAKTLGWPLYIDSNIGTGIDTCLIIGMYDAPEYAHTLACTHGAKRRIIYWCGTDVEFLSVPEALPDATYLCETEWIQRELKEKGVNADVVMFPTTHHFDLTPLPTKKAVAFYTGSNPLKYGAHFIEVLQSQMPDVDFYVYGAGQHGHDEMQMLIDKVNVYMRLTDHDGAAASAREFMEAGRRVLCTVPLDYAEVVSKYDPVGMVRTLRRALKEGEPAWDSAAYWNAMNSKERFLSEMSEVMGDA